MSAGRTASSFGSSDPAPSALARAFAVLLGMALAVTLLCALLMGDAHAQTAATTTTSGTASIGSAVTSPFAGMMQGLIGLVIVLAVIFGASWLLKKIGPRARTGGVVQVVGGVSVGPREKVVAVRFDGRTLLLGVAPGQVSLLHAADATDPVDAPPDATTNPRFVDRLRAARSGA